jgi:hypothetical protein
VMLAVPQADIAPTATTDRTRLAILRSSIKETSRSPPFDAHETP